MFLNYIQTHMQLTNNTKYYLYQRKLNLVQLCVFNCSLIRLFEILGVLLEIAVTSRESESHW